MNRFTHIVRTSLPVALLVSLVLVAAAQAGTPDNYVQAVSPEGARLGTIVREGYQKAAMNRAEAILYALTHNLPVRETNERGQTIEIQAVSNGIPIYYVTTNLNSAVTNGAAQCWPDGELGMSLTGSDQSLGIWDAGAVRTTHIELEGRVTVRDGVEAVHYHATHVAGTMIATGIDPDAKGMAYEADLSSYDWTADLAEMAGAGYRGLPISNHSYSLICGWYGDIWLGDPDISVLEDYRFGFYNELSQDYDSVAANAPNYLIVAAAGNDRGDGPTVPVPGYPPVDGGATGFDCLPGGMQTAKNPLVVGAVEAIPGGYESPSDVIMSSFSGWGPTDDGRIKPDIVADGVDVYSTWSTDDDIYNAISGTSMAAPSVAGALALVRQHYMAMRGSEPTAAMLKALAIHTAREAGSSDGPDYSFGWGLMNTSGAVETITGADEGTAVIYEGSLSAGETFELTIPATGDTPIKATLVWNDPAGTPVQPALDPNDIMLVHDLDLRIVQDAVTYYPWILDPAHSANAATTGDNIRDNVEQVVVDADSGDCVVTVSHKGEMNEAQPFALVISDIDPQIRTLTVRSQLRVVSGTGTISLVEQEIDINGSSSGETPFDDTYPQGKRVELTAPVILGSDVFLGWVGMSGETVCSTPTINFFMAADTTLVALYGPAPAGRSVLTVRSNPTCIDIGGTCPGCSDYTACVTDGTIVTLRAPTAIPGYRFSRWADEAEVTLSINSTWHMQHNGEKTIIAEYAPVAAPSQVTLTVDSLTVEAGDPVIVEIGGTHGGTTSYEIAADMGGLVTLVAPLTAPGDNVFAYWSDADGHALTANPTYTFAPMADTHVVARYGLEGANSSLMSCGLNMYGQLGDNTHVTRNTLRPTLVMGSAASVAAGLSHTLALGPDGCVWAWGRNDHGQLGILTIHDTVLMPALLDSPTDIIAISAGRNHSLAVASDGTVWAWGANGAGQLGDGTAIERRVPVQVPGLTNIVQVAAGAAHSLALDRNGDVWVWGANDEGQLGDGCQTCSYSPVPVSDLAGVKKVAAGGSHSLALTSDGSVYAWGKNDWGQLGNGNTRKSLRPVRISLTEVIDIAAGDCHSLAVREAGQVYGWGANWWGQLGDGTLNPASRPTLARTDWGDTPIQVAAGAYHSAYRTINGYVYSFGWNRHGQLGIGTMVDSSIAQLAPDATGAVDIAAGSYHTEVIADRPATPPIPALAEWTFMVYMDADNDLEYYAIEDFLEIAAVGSTPYVNFVTLMDRIEGYDSRYGDWAGARRGRILQHDTPESTWGERMGEPNMGDPQTLADFITWAQTTYPAEHYALVLWNHGNGWYPLADEAPPAISRGVCIDMTDMDGLSMREMEWSFDQALEEEKLDVIGFDACLMGMAEVAYSVQDYGEVLVASEETIPGPGWPYTNIAAYLANNPHASASSLSRIICDVYAIFYEGYGYDYTLSAVDLTQMWAVTDAVDALALELIENWDEEDLTPIGLAAQQVLRMLNSAIIYNRNDPWWHPYAHGMAIYLPWYGKDDLYGDTEVAFAEMTNWDEFLDAYEAEMYGSWVDMLRYSTQSFADPESIDLYNFCELVLHYAGTGIEMAPGALHSTGSNESGELGLADNDQRDLYEQVQLGSGNVAAVDCGDNHTIALLSDGTVWTCGLNEEGQLGLGDVLPRNEFTQVVGLPTITAIATGSFHSLLLTEDGHVLAAGRNEEGCLGIGSSDDYRTRFTVVPGLSHVTKIAGGGHFSMALTESGQLWVAGRNTDGQLGLDDTNDRPDFTLVTDLADVVDISGGGWHGMVLLADGTVLTTGQNEDGQLGRGSTIDRATFGPVEGLPENIVAISGGAYYALALTDDGHVYGTGRNTDGELGLGDNAQRNAFILLDSVEDVVRIDAGSGSHSMLLTNFGELLVSGRGNDGQLGLGVAAGRNTFAQVDTLPAIGTFAAGGACSFVLIPGEVPPPPPEDDEEEEDEEGTSTATSDMSMDAEPAPIVPNEVPDTTTVAGVNVVTRPLFGDAATTTMANDCIIDNADNSEAKRFTRVSGFWSTSTVLEGAFGASYGYCAATDGVETARARFAAELPSGKCEVYAWWPAKPDRAQNVAYVIHHAGGVTTVRVNQSRDGARWNLLGEFDFNAGSHTVEVHNGESKPGSFISADAVRFSPVE